MLKKLSFLVIMGISFAYTMDLDIQDARILAQGHSQDGYVNRERVAKISKALTIIRNRYTELSNVHIEPNFNISVEIPYKEQDEAHAYNMHINMITRQFIGKQTIYRARRAQKMYAQINFNNNVDIPALIERYKKITGVKHAFQEGVAATGSGLVDIKLLDNKTEWVFMFTKPNFSQGTSQLYNIKFDPVKLAITDCVSQD